ncbi:MAG: IgGFc-binding protein [Candidatus Kapabacteria bacterium]|nr:IgGFc-binding protein [Candidatus Kapabacteria bacterium]
MAPRLIYVVVMFCLLSLGAHGQGLRDSRGQDFWLALPPNEHSTNGPDEALLSILVNCDGPTNVRVEARSRTGTLDVRTVTVPSAAVWEFRYVATTYELGGVTRPNGPVNDCERPMPMSIHVTTSADVSLYAVMRDDNTSDAWMVLPTDALGTSYRISSYASTAVADTTFFLGFPRYSFTEAYPSQFVVVATEDSTDLTIDLSVDRSAVMGGQRRSVRLNQGQSYLVQAKVTETRQNDDLTGTRIVSTKPIGVLSAHLRAQVPILTEISSRDCLVEQLPSVDTWGKRVIVPPLKRANDYQSAGPTDVPVCRILAAEDTTFVQVNGQPQWRINAGAFRDIPLTTAQDIQATKPILVTIIDRSANRNTGGTSRSGDPSLIIMPPAEQFLSAYRVVNAEPRITGTPFYSQHQITCVVPMSSASTLLIDGNTTPNPIPIPGTTFGYVHLNTIAGPHSVACDSAFGIIVYGYGPAESYGYTGGMAFERLYTPTVTLKVLDVVGRAGDVDTIIAIVDSIGNATDFRLSGAVRLAGDVSIELSTFVPDRATIADPSTLRGIVSFVLAFDSLNVGDTVAVAVGRHVLGLDTVTSTTLQNIAWITGANDTVAITTTVKDGRVVTLGVCVERQPRLFDPSVTIPVRQRLYYDLRGNCVGATLDGLPIGVYFRK